MGSRITDLDSPDPAALFTGFEHTAYGLERLLWYGVDHQDASFRAWRAGTPHAARPSPGMPGLAWWPKLSRREKHSRAST
jgi:hypothetical protein